MKSIFKFIGIAFVACSMFVACGDKDDDDFESGNSHGNHNRPIVITYIINALANDEAMGIVDGGGEYAADDVCTLTAIPNAGYVFVNWSDGTTANPYTFNVTEDVDLIANFAVGEGTAVRFKGRTWNAAVSNSYYWPSYNEMGVSAWSVDNHTYPMADAFFIAQGTGSYTDAIDETEIAYGNVVDYVEYYEQTYISDGEYTYGDWWAKSCTINVKGFDATTMNLYFTIDATMFNAASCLDGEGHMTGIANAPVAQMTMVSNTTMTLAANGKGPVTHKKWHNK